MKTTNEISYQWKPQVGVGFNKGGYENFNNLLTLNFDDFFEKKKFQWENYSKNACISSKIDDCHVTGDDDVKTLNFKLKTIFDSPYSEKDFSRTFLPPYQDYCCVELISDYFLENNSLKNQNEKHVIKKKVENSQEKKISFKGGLEYEYNEKPSIGVNARYEGKKPKEVKKIKESYLDMKFSNENKNKKVVYMNNTYHYSKKNIPNNNGYELDYPWDSMLRQNGYIHTTHLYNRPPELAKSDLEINHQYSVELGKKENANFSVVLSHWIVGMSSVISPYSSIFSSTVSHLCANNIFRSKFKTKFLFDINVTDENPIIKIGCLDMKNKDKVVENGQCQIKRQYKEKSLLFSTYKDKPKKEGIVLVTDNNKNTAFSVSLKKN